MPTAKPRRAQDPFVPAARSPRTRRTQLRRFAAGVLVAGGIGAVAFAAGRPATPPAVDLDLDAVTVDPPTVDLGLVRLDVTVPVTVRLLNQSKGRISFGQATTDTLEGR
jgi:hypothetical protein